VVRNAVRPAGEAMEAKRLAMEAANPPIKASEAYGKYEGSYLKPIFYDRMKVDLSKDKFGGPGFSSIQLVDPNYADAKAVAGVTDQKMATRILNRNKAAPKGADVIWTPSVGGLEQHKSNSTMFGEFADIFANQRKNMSAEDIQKLSDRASKEVDNSGRLIFPNGIDLGARNFRQQVKTYDQRSLMANIFAGRGVGGEKGRTVPVEELLEKNLDPNMANAGTLDLGNRLFRLEGDVIDRPDLHSDYRKILTGEDLGVNYLPTPIRDVYGDWEAQKALDLAAQGKNRPVTMMDYTKNDPTIQLTDALLSKMQKAGHKDGGAIDGEDHWLTKMLKGNGMADGGKLVKGGAKVFKKLFSDDVLPAAERDANLAKMLEGSRVKDKLYHATPADFNEFKPGGHNPKISGEAIWLSSDPTYQAAAHHIGDPKKPKAGVQVMPVHVQAKNPMMLDDKDMLEWAQSVYAGGSKEFPELMPKQWADEVKKDYDSIIYADPHGRGDPHEIIMFEPEKIKSAIGNRGTYDITDPDINKAEGGLLHMADAGRVAKGLGKVAKMFVDPAELTPIVKRGTRKFGDEMGGNSIVKEAGGNWLTGSVEKTLKPLKRGSHDIPKNIRDELGIEDLSPQEAALNNWVDRNLTNYVKKQMGTKGDPVRKLADQGILHIDEPRGGNLRASAMRKSLGFDENPTAATPLGQAWENRSDAAILGAPYRMHLPMVTSQDEATEALRALGGEYAAANPNALAFAFDRGTNARHLGFDHIMDVLNQDLAEGRIRPEQLSKVSMEQAVRRTHEYDQEMAKKMRETQAKVTEGMPTHKDYPDKGYKWIELTESKELPKGWSQEPSGAYVGPNGERTIINPSRQNLDSALKYEGNTMGHCVGSYCDDVAGGKSRIYSLRDAKGEPHVTIEVGPHQGWFTKSDAMPDPSGKNKSFHELIDNERSELARQKGGFGNIGELYEDTANRLAKQYQLEANPEIIQIKGKQNRAPKEEYLPFVQDFVKGGNWSEVGDLRNTGLIKRDGKYLTPDEDSDWLLKHLGAEGMAQGGGAFKKIGFYDKGGITTSGGTFSPEELGVSADEIGLSKRQLSNVKNNAKDMWEATKNELSRFKSPRAREQYAKIVAAQMAGGTPDLVHLAISLGLDPLKSVTIDKMLTKPKPRSVLEGPAKTGEKQERVPMFGSIADTLKTSDGYPIGGSEHIIKRAQDAGLMYGKTTPVLDEEGYSLVDSDNEPLQYTSGRFSPLTEIGGAILGGGALSKLNRLAGKGYQKYFEPRVDPAGALSRAIDADSNAMFNPNLRTR